jgi:hypothetical protein
MILVISDIEIYVPPATKTISRIVFRRPEITRMYPPRFRSSAGL